MKNAFRKLLYFQLAKYSIVFSIKTMYLTYIELCTLKKSKVFAHKATIESALFAFFFCTKIQMVVSK